MLSKLEELFQNDEACQYAFVDEQVVCEFFGVTPQTIYVWRRNKGFPQPLRIPGTKKRYSVKAIRRYITAQSND